MDRSGGGAGAGAGAGASTGVTGGLRPDKDVLLVEDKGRAALPKKKALPCSGSFKFACVLREDHGQPVTCVRFCDVGVEMERHFATVGANRATVYELLPNGGIDLAQVYVDEDPEEVFATCAWARDGRSGDPLLAVAGLRGLIKIINCTTQTVVRTLFGHGALINHITFHPVNPSLLLSTSKDSSVRLWNVTTSVCVAMFAGDQGHQEEVLSADFHLLGNCFVSSGLDNRVKIWALDTEAMEAAIKESYVATSGSGPRFKTLQCHTPAFTTDHVHSDHVDSVMWVGNLIVSKSTENAITLWAPDPRRGKDAVSIVKEFGMTQGDVYMLRPCLDSELERMACGNAAGDLFVWDVHAEPPTKPVDGDDDDDGGGHHYDVSPASSSGETELVSGPVPPDVAFISLTQLSSPVRHCAFSPDGKTLVAVSDNSTIWRFDDSAAVS